MKTAIVTGASSGIGRAAAIRLVADGWRVLGVGRDAGALAGLQSEIGTAFVPLVADVTSDEAPSAIVRRALVSCNRGS